MKTRKIKIGIEIVRNNLLPVFWLVLVSAIFILYEYDFKNFVPEVWQKHISAGFFLIFLSIICYVLCAASGAAFEWYKTGIAVKTKTDLDDKFIPLFSRLVNLFIVIVALIVFLARLGVNISALIATLGVGSLAVALAAQDTIANIIAGFLIMVDRPFVAGDEIKLPSGERVKVLEVGIRRSKFYALDDSAIVIVPNLDLSKSRIINYTYAGEK